jgi:hypothetical protein
VASAWFEIPQHFPIHGQSCYVRRMDFWESFEAEWDEAAAEFILLNGYRMPWYSVSRWKPYSE